MVVISQWGVTDGDEHHDIQKTLFIFVFQTLLIAQYLGAFISLVVTEATFVVSTSCCTHNFIQEERSGS